MSTSINYNNDDDCDSFRRQTTGQSQLHQDSAIGGGAGATVLLTTIEQTLPHYDLEKAFEEMGGFGKFQWLATLFLTIARNAGNYMYYGFAYLTMEQMYRCRFSPDDPFTSCEAESVICPALGEAGDSTIEY